MRIKTDENKVWGRGENKDGTRMEAEENKLGDGIRIKRGGENKGGMRTQGGHKIGN